MSRGHGKLERRLLEIIRSEKRLFETMELAGRAYGARYVEQLRLWLVSRAQVMATQRALRALAGEGLILDLGRKGSRKWWVEKRLGDELVAGVAAFRRAMAKKRESASSGG